MSWLVHKLMNNEELTSNLTGGLRHKLTRELMDELWDNFDGSNGWMIWEIDE